MAQHTGWNGSDMVKAAQFLSGQIQGVVGAMNEANDREVYDYIAGKVGSQGDLSTLDGDPMLNNMRGMQQLAKFSQDRWKNEEYRKKAWDAQRETDQQMYQERFLPVAQQFDAYRQKGDTQGMQLALSEMSKMMGGPNQLVPGENGTMQKMFRTDATGKYEPTGNLSMDQLTSIYDNMMQGEYTVVSADGTKRKINPRFMGMRNLYQQATRQSNWDAWSNPDKQAVFADKSGREYLVVPNNDVNGMRPTQYAVVDRQSGEIVKRLNNVDELRASGLVGRGRYSDILKQDAQRNQELFKHGLAMQRMNHQDALVRSRQAAAGRGGGSGGTGVGGDDGWTLHHSILSEGWEYDKNANHYFKTVTDKNGDEKKVWMPREELVRIRQKFAAGPQGEGQKPTNRLNLSFGAQDGGQNTPPPKAQTAAQTPAAPRRTGLTQEQIDQNLDPTVPGSLESGVNGAIDGAISGVGGALKRTFVPNGNNLAEQAFERFGYGY